MQKNSQYFKGNQHLIVQAIKKLYNYALKPKINKVKVTLTAQQT